MTGTVSEAVGQRLRALRISHGWSVRHLVEKCITVGFEATSNIIENIEGQKRPSAAERQRRRVTVDELVALARVFNVPASSLLAPECADCGDIPRQGFTCNACGTRG